MARPPSAKSILKNMKKESNRVEHKTPIANEMFLPNHSGITSHPEYKNDNTFLAIDGSNANQNIEIGTYDYIGQFFQSTQKLDKGGWAIGEDGIWFQNLSAGSYGANKLFYETNTGASGSKTTTLHTLDLENNNSTATLNIKGIIDMSNPFGSSGIKNLIDPTADQDAATKKYVDDNVSSVSFGADNQIPYTNAATNDFDYGDLTYDGTKLDLSKVDPEVRLTDTGNSEYTRVTKSDTSNVAQRLNRVDVQASGVTDQLVSQWTMNDDAANTTVLDSQGANNGTFTDVGGNPNTDAHAAASGDPPNLNGSLSFDGTDDYVDCGSNTLTTGATTICMWVNKDDNNLDPLCSFKIGSNAQTLFYWGSTAAGRAAMMAFRGEHEMYSPLNSLTSGTWEHIVFVYTGGDDDLVTSYKIYINGISQVVTRRANVVGGSASLNRIGKENTGAFPGDIDDVRVYNKELSQAEVDAIYNSGDGNENLAPTQTEVTVWKSEDGVAANEEGIQTFGDGAGKTNIDAGTGIFLNDNTYIQSDSDGLFWGAADDASFKYDGTDFILTTDEVAASDFIVDCGTDKTIELGETVYKDINLAGAVLQLAAANNPNKSNFIDEGGTDTNITTYGFDPNHLVCGSFELQHDYKEGTDIVFHVHFQIPDAPTGTDKVKWEVVYTVARDGETLDAATTITAEQDVDTQYETYLLSFTAVTGTAFKIGDQVLFRLRRVAATADEYGGEALLETFGVHYEVDTLGSRQITTK